MPTDMREWARERERERHAFIHEHLKVVIKNQIATRKPLVIKERECGSNSQGFCISLGNSSRSVFLDEMIFSGLYC